MDKFEINFKNYEWNCVFKITNKINFGRKLPTNNEIYFQNYIAIIVKKNGFTNNGIVSNFIGNIYGTIKQI